MTVLRLWSRDPEMVDSPSLEILKTQQENALSISI